VTLCWDIRSGIALQPNSPRSLLAWDQRASSERGKGCDLHMRMEMTRPPRNVFISAIISLRVCTYNHRESFNRFTEQSCETFLEMPSLGGAQRAARTADGNSIVRTYIANLADSQPVRAWCLPITWQSSTYSLLMPVWPGRRAKGSLQRAASRGLRTGNWIKCTLVRRHDLYRLHASMNKLKNY
jgi:hypothetical protein